MSETQQVLGHNLILFPLIYFFILNLFNYQVVVVSEHLPVVSDEQYIVHFLSTTETQSILLQRCCRPSEVLNKDGHCIPSSSPSGFQPMVPLSLEKRFKRAIQNSLVYDKYNDTIDENLDENAFILRFKFQRPSCGNGFLRQISYNNPGEIQFTTSLQFVIPKFQSKKGSGYHSLILSTHNYCIDNRDSGEGIVVLFCAPENVQEFSPVTKKAFRNKSQGKHVTNTPTTTLSSAASPVLLRKCCQASHVMDLDSFSCVRHDIPWQLYPILSSTEIMIPLDETASNVPDISTDVPVEESEDKNVPLQVSWLTGTPNCEQGFYEVYTDTYDRYYVNSEGILITEQNGTVAKTPQTEFCIDAVIYGQQNESNEDSDQSNNNNAMNSANMDEKLGSIFSRQIALVCFENNMESEGLVDKENDRKFSRRTLYAIFTGISSVFLLVTCLVYTVLRKELKLPGWLQFAYSIALLLTFSLLTVAQLWTQAIHDISKSLCRALGYGLHFSFLVCFFYLTSMNFEIFSSFRSITLAHGFGKVRGKRRFLEFTAFSIGFPLAVTVLLLAVDSCDPDDTNLQGSLCILPTTGIGVDSCVFDSRHKVAQLHYFYGFVGILLMINLVIFVCTLVSLRNRERETRMAKRQSTSTCDYDRLQLFTRLFLIMGILWIFEVISWLFQYFEVDEKVQDIFIVTDCLNASQGFAVFLMFVCKRQTWKQLKKKFKASCGIRSKRPLCRPNCYNGTISSSNNTNGTSVKSSHLSSTKSRDSTRVASTSISIATVVGPVENGEPLKSET